MDKYYENLLESVEYIEKRIKDVPVLGIVLGSGLGMLADKIEDKIELDYKDIPNYPVSTIPGHAGRLIFGYLSGKYVACMSGRFHYYEGYEPNQIHIGVRTFKLLGAKGVIITNAAGGINTSFNEGAIMLIKDHIGFLAPSALRGPNIEEFGERFFDMTRVYDRQYLDTARKVAKKLGIDVKEGVYMFFKGPNFETPAEIRAARILGADAAGMSTVPEVVACSHCGLKVLGISVITNMAAGILDKQLSHAEVMETANRIRKEFVEYVEAIVKEL
ncbi:MAG TPA: purine-nucleoside phosphorylase [Clostridia bacterium]|jgi:purine-nucleoside phosphorylase|nr:purine-nucleoside phosphorylase [Clostridiaceae bacterium]HOF27381.1 purine-nucleoside phosphorylase [Clostridia bacterium]HOM34860.1 purine-nucleoside phosphorylase [Clostridia bacterium]HOR90522.1 purine-nucleoside phosphorylase [Clostridia bacterium]HOT71198.1 purine-nucleoside phosphorylase [Clostridia bacterium]